MNWQYATADLTVANRINEQGQQESCLVSALPEGTVIDAYVAPPPPIPQSVTKFQALAVLAAGGYLGTIRTYIATLGEDDITRLAWENATDWERTSPTLNALAAMLGLSDAQVDDLFVAASHVSA